jgi:DNA-binding transcriptional LysR family regulator
VDLRHLRYFQAVAEELSYSRAAARLRIAQPALSRAVKDIEAELGVQLFERSRHHVRITPAGATLRREAALLLESWEESLRRVRRTGAGEEGELRLGYVGPPTDPFLGRLLREYRRRYPRVALHLEERTPERSWEAVARGRLTAAITRPVPTHQGLQPRTLVLRHEPLGAVVAPDHPLAERRVLSWKALHAEPLIVLARREGMSLHDAVLAACRENGFPPRLAETPSLIGTLFRYVEAGVGIGVTTDSVVQAGSGLRFIPLRPRVTVPLVLVWRDEDDPPSAQRFRELLSEWMEAGLLWKS